MTTSYTLHLVSSVFILLLMETEEAGMFVKCRPPFLKSGRTRVRSNGRIVKFICNPGFQLLGEKYSTCLRGRWDTPIPICIKSGCRLPYSVKNGETVESYRGALIKVHCDPGYVINGSSAIHCNGYVWNDTLPSCQAKTEPAQLSCDFESEDLCGWSHDPNQSFNWRQHNFITPSAHLGTGPEFDHTLGIGLDGHYMYLESSSPRLENDTARLYSPIFQPLMTNNSCLVFWYHMYGATTGALNVYLQQKLVFTKSGNQGNQWIKSTIPLNSSHSVFQVIIEGVRGTGYAGDTAIDDVNITNGSDCNPDTATTATHRIASCKNRCQNNSFSAASSSKCDCFEGCFTTATCCEDFLDECGLALTTRAMPEISNNSSTSQILLLPSLTSSKALGILANTTNSISKLSTIRYVFRNLSSKQDGQLKNTSKDFLLTSTSQTATTRANINFTASEIDISTMTSLCKNKYSCGENGYPINLTVPIFITPNETASFHPETPISLLDSVTNLPSTLHFAVHLTPDSTIASVLNSTLKDPVTQSTSALKLLKNSNFPTSTHHLLPTQASQETQVTNNAFNITTDVLHVTPAPPPFPKPPLIFLTPPSIVFRGRQTSFSQSALFDHSVLTKSNIIGTEESLIAEPRVPIYFKPQTKEKSETKYDIFKLSPIDLHHSLLTNPSTIGTKKSLLEPQVPIYFKPLTKESGKTNYDLIDSSPPPYYPYKKKNVINVETKLSTSQLDIVHNTLSWSVVGTKQQQTDSSKQNRNIPNFSPTEVLHSYLLNSAVSTSTPVLATTKWKSIYKFKGSHARFVAPRDHRLAVGLAGIACTTLLLATTIVATVCIVRRRKIRRQSNMSDSSDVHFLTSDEILDFNLARPHSDDEQFEICETAR